MDDIEETLSEIALEAPSQEFDEAMEAMFARAHAQSLVQSPRFPRSWRMAAACVCCVGIGALGMRYWESPVPLVSSNRSAHDSERETHYTTVYIIAAPEFVPPVASRPTSSNEFWTQPMRTTVRVGEPIEAVVHSTLLLDTDRGDAL